MNKEILCPECKSTKIIKRGQRKTQNRGLIQRYSCKECSHRFVIDDGFFRMRNAPQKVTFSIDLFYRGISTREIQSHLQSFFPHNSSHMTIYRWVVRYAKLISKFTDNLKIQPIRELQVDEMLYKRRLYRNRKGTDTNWFIDAIDTKTRYLVSCNFSRTREQDEIKRVLHEAKNKAGKIEICTTDGFTAYENAIKNVFGYNRFEGKFNVVHNKVTQLKNEGFNHRIERMHNSIRQRTKVFRGFHGSLGSADAIMQGYQIYYNFIRKHQAINRCPYELATDLKLSPENKWLQLIKLAKDFKNADD